MALAIATTSFFEAREKDIVESATLVVTPKNKILIRFPQLWE